MKALPYLLALACIGLTFWAVHEGGRADDVGAALRAERQAHDTTKARNAEREVQYMAGNDSLKATLAAYKQRGLNKAVIVRADTVLIPESTWVYITDTVVPRCSQCAARLDSLVTQNRDERRAAQSVIDLLGQSNVALKKKLDRQSLTSRVGIFVGYGATRVSDGTVRAGLQVGFGVRVFP